MTDPISGQQPVPNNSTQMQAIEKVPQTESDSQNQPLSLMYFVMKTILVTLSTISHGMVVRSKSISIDQQNAQAALQVNNLEILVQVHSTKSGATLGQFTQQMDINRMIEQSRLVSNGYIQEINTNASEVMSRESAAGQNLSATYNLATGVLQVWKNVMFKANLTTKPQN